MQKREQRDSGEGMNTHTLTDEGGIEYSHVIASVNRLMVDSGFNTF